MTTGGAIIERLQKEKYRITPARRAVIELLTSAHSPLSAPDLAAMLKKKKVRADKTTVYREIAFLLKSGIVRELQFDERSKRYEVISGQHTHHLICTSCSVVEAAVLNHDLDAVERRLKAQKKFKVQHHSLEFYGLCASCQ